MLRFLPVLLMLGMALLALIDCIAREDDEVRGLPKIVWVFVILLFPLLGSLAWFFAGRPRTESADSPFGGLLGQRTRQQRPLGPDDDPEFLKGLNRPRKDEDD